jgi:hypothetical protein
MEGIEQSPKAPTQPIAMFLKEFCAKMSKAESVGLTFPEDINSLHMLERAQIAQAHLPAIKQNLNTNPEKATIEELKKSILHVLHNLDPSVYSRTKQSHSDAQEVLLALDIQRRT